MMLDFEYALFTTEDPIKLLREGGSKLSLPRKFKYAPHVRRAEALVKKSQKWRDVIVQEGNPVHENIGAAFASYFGSKLDKGTFFAVPRDVTYDFITYINKNSNNTDDKYMRKVTNLILAHSDYIDAFVKAFLSIRLAQGELDKLQSK